MRRLILFMSVLVFVITAFASCRYTDQISIVDDSVKNEQEIDTTETEGSNPSQSKKLIHGIDIVNYPDIYSAPEYERLTEGQKIAYIALCQAVDDIIKNGIQVNKEYPLNARISDLDRISALSFFNSNFNIFNDIVCFIASSDSQGSQDFCDSFYLANLDNSDHFEDFITDSINKYLECEAMADDILSSLDHDGTDYGKALSIARWMVDNIVFPDDYSDRIEQLQTEYNTLKYREAVCGGFARTFNFLCKKSGIDIIYILGIGLNGTHAWNMINIDENWYHVDVTWMTGAQFYRNFMMSDEICSLFGHEKWAYYCTDAIKSEYFTPIANSYDLYEYYFESAEDVIKYFNDSCILPNVSYELFISNKDELNTFMKYNNTKIVDRNGFEFILKINEYDKYLGVTFVRNYYFSDD